jgi:SAM-dependent methyltransferase
MTMGRSRIARAGSALADHVFHVAMRMVDELIDAAWGIDTRREHRYGAGETAGLRHADPMTNMPSYYARLLALRRFLDLRPDDVVVDLGCGDGRAVAVFARSRAGRCIGVEFDAVAAAASRRNATRLRWRQAPVEIINGDVAAYRFRDETVIYLFNPCGPATLRAILANLKRSLDERPRRLRLCYYHPEHGAIVENAGWLRRTATLGGLKTDIVIYEPKPVANQ